MRSIPIPVLAGAVAVLLPAAARAQGTAHLRLHEAFAYPFPDSLRIVSMVAREPDELLAWAPNQGAVLHVVHGTVTAVGAGHLRLPVGAAFVDGGIEVVDAQRRGIVAFAADGAERGFRAIDADGAVRNAVRTRAGWMVGLSSARDGYRVLNLAGDSAREVARIPADTSVGAELREGQLASDGDAVLVTDTHAPFTTRRVPDDGTTAATLEPGLPADSVEGAKWVPLPMLALGDGYVQVLADVTSDRRVLVLFDAAGRVLRQTRLAVPLAFVTTVPGLHLLVGSRAVGARELIGYRWEWEREGSP